MKRFTLFLVSLPLLAVPPVVTVTGFDGISHSTVRITFDVSATYDHLQTRYIASPGTCSGGSGGLVQTITYNGSTAPPGFLQTSNMSIVLGGLKASTLYNVCPEVSNDGGTTYSSGVSSSFTTTAFSTPHPTLPVAPTSFDSSYPNTGTGLTACPTLSSTNYCTITVLSDCSDLQAAINTGQTNQVTNGTVILIPHGSVCTGLPRVGPSLYSADIITFAPADVVTGSPGKITFSGGVPFTEGQLLTFGYFYGSLQTPPTSSSCEFGNGFIPGGKYLVHIEDSTHISLKCGDGTFSAMNFSTAGTGPYNFELIPHFVATGTCPSITGPVACTYWKRGIYQIIVRSDSTQLPPAGVRLSPGFCAAGQCATLVDPLANVNNSTSAAWFLNNGTADGNQDTMSGNFRWGPGLQINMANDPSNQNYCNLVNTSPWNSDIIFDRVYFHGSGSPQNWGGPSCNAMTIDGMNIVIRDGWIDNLTHSYATNGIDSTSINFSRGPGPTMVYNNRIEGAGIPLHFDDEGGTLFVRGDNSLLRNTFFASLVWMHGSATSDGLYYGMRQPLEFKAGRRILISGNSFINTWNQNTQSSVFIAITSVAGMGVTDVNVSLNSFAHGPGGINAPTTIDGGARITLPPVRFAFTDNLLYDINGIFYTATNATAQPGRGWLLNALQGGEDATVKHNSVLANTGVVPSIFSFEDTNYEGMDIESNMFTGLESGTQGVRQDGGVASNLCIGLFGEAQLICKMNTGTNPGVFTKNLLMSTDGSNQATVQGWFPTLNASNFVPSSMSLNNVGFYNYAIDDTGDFHLTNNSIYNSGGASHGADHKQLGTDINKLLNAQGQVGCCGVGSITTTTASVSFRAPDIQSCPIFLATSPWGSTYPSYTSYADSGTSPGRRSVALTSLATHTVYYGMVMCSSFQPTFQFKTN